MKLETGNILYANLTLNGQNNPLYFFNKKNFEGHYDEGGKSIKSFNEDAYKWCKTFFTFWYEKTSYRWI